MSNSPWTRKPSHRASVEVRQDGTTYSGRHAGQARMVWMDNVTRCASPNR